MSSRYTRVDLSTISWRDVLAPYLTEEQLSGNGASCPVCGGDDRFTFNDKTGLGDWICRKHAAGHIKGGKGIDLIMEIEKVEFVKALDILRGGASDYLAQGGALREERSAESEKRTRAKAFFEQLTRDFWTDGAAMVPGDAVSSYLLSRVPGIDLGSVRNIRTNRLLYRHNGKSYGNYTTMVARFESPEGEIATTHRTYLDPKKPAKIQIVESLRADGTKKMLDPRKQGASLIDVHGGAIRLIEPRNGVLGVAEGIETALGAFMCSGVATWSCLNRVLLESFRVPKGMGIHTVEIFADYDHIDIETGVSPGMASAIILQKRLKAEGFKVVFHRPSKIGTDFADQWLTEIQKRGRLRAA